jgi:hypothetical protein
MHSRASSCAPARPRAHACSLLLRQERGGADAGATTHSTTDGVETCDAVPRVAANEERSGGGDADTSPSAFTPDATPGAPAAPVPAPPKRPRAKSAPKPSVCPNMLVLVRLVPCPLHH